MERNLDPKTVVINAELFGLLLERATEESRYPEEIQQILKHVNKFNPNTEGLEERVDFKLKNKAEELLELRAKIVETYEFVKENKGKFVEINGRVYHIVGLARNLGKDFPFNERVKSSKQLIHCTPYETTLKGFEATPKKQRSKKAIRAVVDVVKACVVELREEWIIKPGSVELKETE